MKCSLTEASLAEVCNLVTDGTHDTPKRVPSGFPLIKAKEIVTGQIDFSSCDQISESEHRKVIARSKPEFGDTLFTHIGASLGAAAYVNTTREFSIKNIALFKPNPVIIDARYLYYVVLSPEFQSLAIGTKTGSAQPFLGLSQLRGHRIHYHRNLPTQRRIAGILSAYDELIENSQRRIKILESMARGLYREWFVHFRFPGHESVPRVPSTMGEIPKGWEVKTVQHYGKVITGKTPSKSNKDFYGDNVPFVKTPDMHGNIFIQGTTERLSATGAESQANKMLPAGSICVSCIGTIGVVAITTEDCQTNQQINSVILENEFSREFLFLRLQDSKQTLENLGSNGATMGNVNKGKFEAMKIVAPSTEVLAEYHRLARSMFEEILVLSRQIQNLRRTRDLLLPRLLSGQVELN
jgi:type I restriction enzyme S subunit